MSHKLEQQKNYEYRDSFRWVLISLIAMLILCVMLSVCVGYKAIYPGPAKYYASMTTGEVIPLPPLNEPVVTNKYLVEWASLATRAAFNLDFGNYDNQLKAASVYFTNNGWNAFNKALTHSGLLDMIKSKKLMMSAVVPQTPVIVFTGIFNGRYMWRVSLPVLVTYGSASEQQQRQLKVNMVISRVPALDTPQGIQVIDFEAK
ncbi:MAG: type IVB secretion system apparatus protein IcmL/DotI [Proteobacteria bacterium]|nr:type IVB secretion system apparatus protein IcmL/DotI [Pseudomonadota bacterium]